MSPVCSGSDCRCASHKSLAIQSSIHSRGNVRPRPRCLHGAAQKQRKIAILPTSLMNLPCLLEKHGVYRRSYCTRKIEYQKLVTLLTSFYVTMFLAARKVVQVFPDVFPHKIRLVHEARDGPHAPHRRSMGAMMCKILILIQHS